MIWSTESYPMASPVIDMQGFPVRPRVLVAEDQEDVIAALHLLLKSAGYEAEFVRSPEGALKALQEKTFDAILLDLNYSRDTTSGTEGLELLSKVQAMDSSLAVVVMTAWGSIELAVKAMHRGACDFVQKPWDNRQLLNVLEEQMKRSKELKKKRFSEELEQSEAAQIQRALMPGEIPAGDGLAIVASSKSARNVGGDYYDVIPLAGQRSAICIADVVGKGMGAALLMSNLQAAVRMLAPEISEPKTFCDRVNRAISGNNFPGKFITFFYCVMDTAQKRIDFTNAGHNWPVLAHADGTCERLNSEDVVLGTVQDWNYHQLSAALRSGDRLVLFTDGITECADSDGMEFGEDRLVDLVSRNVHLAPDKLKDVILKAAECHGSFVDDATLIVVEVQ
jgi:phosphoserine phosphatase RsbU/P